MITLIVRFGQGELIGQPVSDIALPDLHTIVFFVEKLFVDATPSGVGQVFVTQLTWKRKGGRMFQARALHQYLFAGSVVRQDYLVSLEQKWS